MIKKLFFSLLFMVLANNANAISIGMIGDFNGWGGDVLLTDSGDGTNYTLTDYTFLSSGTVKFRQDAGWATSWGCAVAPGFPTGGPGGTNISVPAGSYDITLNIVTGVYMFTVHPHNYDSIAIYGGFDTWTLPGTSLATTDGVSYVLPDTYYNAANVKFSKTPFGTTTPQDWGATAFPTGVATSGGGTIPLTAGYYNAGYNNTTGAYYFLVTPVSMIGNGVSDWNTDVDMTSTDGGISWTLAGVDLVAGQIKFRANYSWASNWGDTAFPSGTGILNGNNNNIPITTPGNYDVTFNRLTGAYTFTMNYSAYALTNFNGAAMSTADGVTYILTDTYVPAAINANFVDPNDATKIWGATAFPAGTATLGSTSTIPVPAGYYTVTFNRTTGVYSFAVSGVSLIGSGTPGAWATDTAMTTTDNGLTYTLASIVLTAGEVKFRVNNGWTTAYGAGATDFPSGTATTTGGNITDVAGTYSVTFNRVTGAYVFTLLNAASNASFSADQFAVYPNPTTANFSVNGTFDKAQIYSISGQLVKTFNASATNTYNISDLNAGIYLVKITDANNAQKTVKLIKQ